MQLNHLPRDTSMENAEPRVSLCLGGGGMKGLAHVGVWRALEESGLAVGRVVGTSIGALVGACIAGRMRHDELAALARALQKPQIATMNRWALLFNGIRQPALFRDEPFREYIDSVLPVTTFAELDLPLSVNAVDLSTGEEVWFGAGGDMDVPLADAVYASCALPVFYPPALIGERYYVDGGVRNALPVRAAVEGGAGRVIAVDVSAGMAGDGAAAVETGMIAIHQRVMQIMGGARRGLEPVESDADVVYIRPDLDGYPTFDFTSTEYFLAEGYRAARQALGGGDWRPAAVI
jgi:NTE family protein